MAFPRYDLSVLDNVPRAASGADVYVYTQPTSPALTNPDGTLIIPSPWSPTQGGLATIYSDPLGAYPLSNPFPLDGNGNGWFYAVASTYTVVINGSTLAYPSILPDQNLILASAGGVSIEVNGTPTSNQALLNLVQGGNVTLTASGGNVIVNSAASPVTLQVNGTAASSQTLQNLIAGAGVTITDGGGGQITFASTGGVTFQVNGTPTTSQSTINFVSGTNVTVSNPSAGNVSFVAAYPVFEANSTPLSSSATINIQAGSGISVTNPSAGNILITNNSGANTFSTTVTLTAAQILALNATPFTLVTAQGAGTIIVPLQVEYEFNEVGAAFSNVHSSDLAVYLTASAVLVTGTSTGLLDQTTQTFESCYPGSTPTFGTTASLANQPLVLSNLSSAYTGGGTSTLDVTVTYAVVAVV